MTPAATTRLLDPTTLAGKPWAKDLSSTGLAGLVDRVSSAIADTCPAFAPWGRERVRETLAAPADVVLVLARRPVESIVSVVVDGDAVTDHRVEDARVGTLYREEGWGVYRALAYRGRFRRRAVVDAQSREVVVEYWHGYVLPEDDPEAAPDGALVLPGAVVEAALATVEEWAREGSGAARVASRSVTHPGEVAGASAISFHTPSLRGGALPVRAMALLRPYSGA